MAFCFADWFLCCIEILLFLCGPIYWFLGFIFYCCCSPQRVVVDPSCLKGISVVSSTTWSHLGFRILVHFYFLFESSSSNFIHLQIETQFCQCYFLNWFFSPCYMICLHCQKFCGRSITAFPGTLLCCSALVFLAAPGFLQDCSSGCSAAEHLHSPALHSPALLLLLSIALAVCGLLRVQRNSCFVFLQTCKIQN